MSVFKTTFSRALRVYPSDLNDIPYPNVIESGIGTSVSSFKLIDTTGFFITNNVKTGDVVYNNVSLTSSTVVSVDSETQITLSENIFTYPSSYIIYSMSPQTGIGNPGCFLYIGGAGNVSVITIGGDQITFNSVPAGTTLPIQVLRLRSTGTTATNVNALW